MSQVITNQRYGQRTILGSWHSSGRAIVEYPNHTFGRWSGDPIQSFAEFEEVHMTGPALERARRWWEHRDEAEDTEETTPRVGWLHAQLVNLDTGVPITTYQAVLAAFPEPGPFQDAAFKYLERQQQQRPTALDMGTPHDLPFVLEPREGPKEPSPSGRDKTGKFLPKGKRE